MKVILQAMNTELFISSRMREQTDIAILREGKLAELHNESEQQNFNVGDVYLATVKKLVPGLNAAFVDVGYEKDAFLHYHDLGPQVRSLNKYLSKTQKGKQQWSLQNFEREHDIPKDGQIDTVLKSGQKVLVQIAKEPISSKGPRITSEISIAGRFMVLVPFSDRVSVSQKIESREEKDRLKGIVKPIKPEGFGVIIRTVAEGRHLQELESDLQALLKKWKILHRNINSAKPPICLHNDLNKSTGLLRDLLNDSFTAIQVDSEDMFQTVWEYLNSVDPTKTEMLKLHSGKIPLFEHFGVERQIKTAFGRSVTFGRGAYLIIEHTEAMHVIDVNSGNRKSSGENQEANALEVNLQAAEEIARQLRLRDMGGIIVVDFIDLHKSENRKELFEKLKDCMKDDRAKHKILPPSRFGLIEITRQRVRPEMNIKTREEDPNGSSKEIEAPINILHHIENHLTLISSQDNVTQLFLHMHPFLAAYVEQGWFFSSLRYKWSKKYKVSLKIIPRDGFRFLEYHFYNSKDVKYELN